MKSLDDPNQGEYNSSLACQSHGDYTLMEGDLAASIHSENQDLGSLNATLSGDAPKPTSHWAWASEATHEMLIHWLCPVCAAFNKLPREQQLSSRRIRCNPVYWVCAWFPTVICLYVGLKTHMLLGQSGPVGAEETRCGVGCQGCGSWGSNLS